MRTRRVTGRRGTAALEFGLVAPVMLLFVIGIIEFGRLMWTREALAQVAFSGARCMGVLGASCASGNVVSTTAAGKYIQAVGAGWEISIPADAISVNANTTCGNVSGFSQVTLHYAFYTSAPSLIKALAPSVMLTVQACYPNQPA